MSFSKSARIAEKDLTLNLKLFMEWDVKDFCEIEMKVLERAVEQFEQKNYVQQFEI